MSIKVDFKSLRAPDLVKLMQELDQSVKVLQAQINALLNGQKRFQSAQETMQKLHNAKSRQILVPLTSSVYQHGELCDVDHFTVDIGAGYFIERQFPLQQKYLDKCVLFCNHFRRIKHIEESVKRMAALLIERRQWYYYPSVIFSANLAETRLKEILNEKPST